jgi:transposase
MAPPSKKAQAEGRAIVFVDQSAFYLLPAAVKTYAPKGQTPVLRRRLSREHWSVMGGVTPQGKLYLKTQGRPYRGVDVVAYLRHLLRHIPGKLLVVWDGAPIHRSGVVKAFLAQGAAQRLHLAQLPPYAPELNPAEGLWSRLKRVELKNVCCQSLLQLRSALRKAVWRLRQNVQALVGCVKQPGFY